MPAAGVAAFACPDAHELSRILAMHIPGDASAAFVPRSRDTGLLAEARRHPDLVVLVISLVADIRLLQGVGLPASFTLFELVIWLYCAPWLLGQAMGGGLQVAPAARGVVVCYAAYVGWIMFAATCAVIWRGSTDVAQLAKNVVPGLVLLLFLAVRLRAAASWLLTADVYVLWTLASCLLAIVQVVAGGPYLKPLVDVTDAKLALSGELVVNPAVGFMRHPNVFALSVLPAVMIAAMKVGLDLRQWRRVRPCDVAALGVLVAGLVLSEAKGAIIWCAVAVVASSLIAGLRGPLPRLVLVIAVDTAITLYSLRAAQLDPSSSLATVETRFLLWQTALSALQVDRFTALFGDAVGYMRDWSGVMANWTFPSAHNGWLDQVVYFGLPGLLAYAAVWWSFFVAMRDAGRRAGRGSLILARAAEASVLAMAGLYLFEPAAADVYFVAQWTLLIGLGTAAAGASRGRAAVS